MNSEARRDNVPRYLILVFLLFAIGIGGAGYLYYEAQTRDIKKERQADLSAIVDLKAKGILDWRTERGADAGVIFENPIVARRVRWFLETPNTPSQLKKELVDWMVSMQEHYEYESIFLLDRKGEVRLAVNAEREQISRGVQTLAMDAMRAKKVVFSDLRRNEVTEGIDLDIFVPLLIRQEGDTLCIGAYVLRIDPYHFLYPLIQSWPAPSRTSETLLIRRDGSEVLYLNELRLAKDTALSLRLPLSRRELPAALAVQGKEGIVEGIDYRGVPVLAVLRGIPDSPWFLVAKVDLDEVYAPIRERAYIVIVIVIILIALTGGIVVVLLREQRLRYYRNQYKAELERSALVQHYGYLTKYANDIILLTDEAGRVVEANDRAVAAYGYTREELIGRDIRGLVSSMLEPSVETRMGQITERNGMVFESVHQRKDGSVFPVESSSRVIEVEGRKFVQSIVRDITERKSAEETLRYERNLLRTLIDNLPDGIYVKDSACRKTIANQADVHNMGLQSEAEALGKDDLDLFPKDLAEGFFADDQSVLQTGRPVLNREEYVLETEGQKRWLLTSKLPLRDDKGQIIGLVGIGRDITERKRVEEALKESESRFRSIIESSKDGIILFDGKERKILFGNGAMAKLLGCSKEDLVGRSIPSLHPSEEWASIEQEFQKHVSGEVLFSAGIPVLCSDGSVLYADISSSLITLDGRSYFSAFFRDITERKRVEAALRTSEAQLSNAVKMAHLGHWEYDVASDLFTFNDHFYAMFRTTAEQVGGYTMSSSQYAQRFVHPDDMPVVGVEIRKALETTDPQFSRQIEHRIIYSDGEIGYITVRFFIVKDDQGRTVKTYGVNQDITERRRAEETVREAEEKFRMMFENVFDGISIYSEDPDPSKRRLIECNERYAAMAGRSREELLQLGSTQGLQITLEDTANDVRLESLAKGTAYRGSFSWIRPDGKENIIEYVGRPITWRGGSYSIGIDRDITERKRTDAALERERGLLRALIENLPSEISVKDTRGRIILANTAALAAFGAAREEEVLGKTDLDLVKPHLAEQHQTEERTILNTGIPLVNDEATRFSSTTGEIEKCILRTKVPLEDSHGERIGVLCVNQNITERKRAEEALRHEKALMDALMDNIPDSIYFKDRQCHLVRLNRKMLQSLKLDEMSQAIGKTDVDLYGEEFGRTTLANDQRLMTSGEPIVARVESRQLEDGQINWTLTTKVPLRDDSGQIVGLVGITREINELMRVQEVLSEERNLLRALIDNLPDQVFVKDRESRFLVCNAGVARRARAGSPTELLEKTDFDILPQEAAAEYYTQEQRIMESGDPIVDQEAVFIEKGGVKSWFSTTKIPLRDSHGNIIGLVGVNRDMTERKRTEERLQLSDQILQRVNALVLVGDANGETTYVSPSVKRILGYDPAEILGDGWWNISQENEEGRKREKDLTARSARGEITLSATPYEKIVKSRDGVSHHILWQDTQGPENTVIGVGHDISERKLLEEQLRQAQKLESLGTLAGGIAHDFNNVLGIILGYTSILEDTKAGPKKSLRSVAAINKAVQRGAALVRQLLTFARKTDTLFESVRLNDVIVELASMLQQTFPRTIQVSSQLEKEIPSITGDGNQLHQALLNLSVNARDAMPSGGTLTFATRAVMGAEVRRRFPEAQREKYVCISVADTGIGMDKPLLARAFEPFFTTKEEGHGTGLGLAVVYGIVASHHGFIDVDSQVGHGTTFRLYFPIPERSIQVPLIVTEEPQAQAAGGTETLLVVEDEEMMLDLLKNILAGKGYRVMTAKDGAEAIEVYTQHKDQIDLVLMDMGLPKLSGAEVLQRLQGINPKVKVILASGYVSPHMKSEVLKAGVKHFVQKPYIPQEVLRHIRKVLESDKRL
ncbi:MAG: PAS domain S-box protein [Bacteroidota bacterium]